MGKKFPPERREALVDHDRGRVLNPQRIMSMMPIEPHNVVMDVGCGNGFFAFPLAQYLSSGKLYAVDMQEEMLGDVRKRIAKENIKNIDPVLSKELEIPLPRESLDGVFCAFMFHETEDPPVFLRVVKSLIKTGGWLTLIEWYKREMESGPPVEERIDEDECLRLLLDAGFQLESYPYLSDEHYMFVLRCPDR